MKQNVYIVVNELWSFFAKSFPSVMTNWSRCSTRKVPDDTSATENKDLLLYTTDAKYHLTQALLVLREIVSKPRVGN